MYNVYSRSNPLSFAYPIIILMLKQFIVHRVLIIACMQSIDNKYTRQGVNKKLGEPVKGNRRHCRYKMNICAEEKI